MSFLWGWWRFQPFFRGWELLAPPHRNVMWLHVLMAFFIRKQLFHLTFQWGWELQRSWHEWSFPENFATFPLKQNHTAHLLATGSMATMVSECQCDRIERNTVIWECCSLFISSMYKLYIVFMKHVPNVRTCTMDDMDGYSCFPRACMIFLKKRPPTGLTVRVRVDL